ncbi:nucleotidyltransferase family protein [Caballeronia zhejiangensis]|uniref:DNA polymerase subunit beta n=1 Tax=Caballeronia zhejiangensis TaxID=871203 RepID=A0A656Q9B2_9BURK|nr:nucleotidyltransferase domain-containing protein [Caballeronia zhejiangensis]KDR25416.1 DNA polymerase subunit beta [Caballeronia zhejiangensis]
MGVDEKVVQALSEWSEGNPLVRRAYVFGSRARGDFTDKSDLDVALEIDPADGETAFTTWMFESPTWLRELQARLPYRLDLWQLDGDDTPVIKLGIERSSVMVYQRNAAS